MEAIRLFSPDSREYCILTIASMMLNQLDKETTYMVSDCWFDFGARMSWTTIIATDNRGLSWQFFNPKNQEDLLKGGLKGIYACVTKKLEEVGKKNNY